MERKKKRPNGAMIGKRAGNFLVIGVASAPPSLAVISPSSTLATPSFNTEMPSASFSAPASAELTAWIRSDRQTKAAPEPVYEVGRDTVILHFGANQDATYILYAFYDFYTFTKSEAIGNGTLKAGQEASLELAAVDGLRAFRLVVEAAGQQVTITASVLCLWVD
ncbi:MAG: hypothetical protein NTV14_00510 [Coprothermobacterota bacterium]|nr:hypothetical protein [Coprothermobacterota bacterium]